MNRFINYKNSLAALLVVPFFANAEGTSGSATLPFEFYLAIGLAAFTLLLTLITCFYVLYILNFFVNQRLLQQQKPAFNLSEWIFEKFISGKMIPVAQEQTIMLDHNYDGIVELDNKMPPWLKFLFLGTITFAIIYLGMFMVTDIGALPLQEYEEEIAMADKLKEERNALAANSIDENSVKAEAIPEALEEGKAIYLQNCKACHGGLGEGGVGPNLTDNFWLHGGSVNDVFKTIKYGVPQKGMISWQAKLKPVQIQKVASYILSIKGTNPPKAKAPQGTEAL